MRQKMRDWLLEPRRPLADVPVQATTSATPSTTAPSPAFAQSSAPSTKYASSTTAASAPTISPTAEQAATTLPSSADASAATTPPATFRDRTCPALSGRFWRHCRNPTASRCDGLGLLVPLSVPGDASRASELAAPGDTGSK